MKSIPTLVAAGSLALSALLACKEKAAPDAQAAAKPALDAEPPASAGPGPAFAVPDTFRNALGKVYEGYIQIQTALAQDDLPKAKEAFSSMHATLHMMPKDGMDSAAKAYWDSTDAHIMAALHPMASAESLDSVRLHFVEFSAIMVDAIQKFGLGGDAPVHQFHCPMVDGNRGGDWLQKEKELRNPYFGKSMLTCGSLVKTLKG